MARQRDYTLTFAPEALDHLDGIEKKYHRGLEKAVHEQLTHSPAAETRNRKPLRQPAPFAATWELRCGPDNRFRVLYDVNADESTVFVLAIGVKERNRLIFGHEVFES